MGDRGRVGSGAPTLVVLRGPSGSGKSTIARALRERYGRGLALVEQDYLRRVVLRERDVDGGLAPALIDQTVRFALEHGMPVVLEGIMVASRYRTMLTRLLADHCGGSHVFFLQVGWEGTLARHATRPQAAEFTGDDMRGWYVPDDVLGVPGEVVIPESSTLQDSIDLIESTAGLAK